MNPPSTLLEVSGLTVGTTARGSTRTLVSDVSVAVAAGQTVGVVGESGCGKSTLLRAIAGVLPRGLQVTAGEIRLGGAALDTRRPSGEVAMVFQDPMTGLNPVMTVADHITEVPRRRDGLSRADSLELAVGLLREVGISDAERRLDHYPHQLSGGLRQRVLIAAALSGAPKLLLCDEPTTALDVTVQARFVGLLRHLVAERGIGILYVTHDLPLLGTMCDSINVMYAGQVIEAGPREAVLTAPAHPYTAALLAAAPRITARTDVLRAIPGHPPLPGEQLVGCRFAARCPYSSPECSAARGLGAPTGGHDSACVRHAQISPLVARSAS